MDYDAACATAATNQGLDPVLKALEDAGLVHGLAQTGGFCMVATVPYDEGTWGITDDEGSILAVWYPGTSWDDGEEGPVFSPANLEALVNLVRGPLA